MASRVRDLRTDLSPGRAELARLQQQLLPRPSTGGPFRLAWACRPAGVIGGDLVAVSAPAPEQVLLLVADAMGHGPAAALIASAVRAGWHLARRDGVSAPAELLARLNGMMCELFDGTFATAACCLLDGETGTLTCSLAGHPPVLVRRPGGAVEALGTPSLPLGLCAQAGYEERRLVLVPGAVVLLSTDGVSDGVGDLADCLAGTPARSARGVVRSVMAAARRGWRHFPPGQRDDCAALAARWRGEKA
jgi:serine phosphatase RsbU (regulator of sigma subunit)